MAGTIIADRVQLDNLTDTFKIVSNTGVEIVTANSSGILTGVADGTVSESKIVDGAVTNAKLTLAANASAIKTALNASGDASIYSCRAWVNFNGTGTVAIRASGNVSSITDNGTGNYTVNFTTAMPDANYSWSTNVWGYEACPPDIGTPINAGSLQFISYYVAGTTGQRTNWDAQFASVIIFR